MSRRSVAAFALAFASLVLVGCKSESNSSNNDGGGLPEGCPEKDDLISDFATDNSVHPVDGRQGGWYTYGDPKGTFASPGGYDIDSSMGGPCSGPGALHVKATGFSDWGAAAGVDFKPRSPGVDGGVGPKMTYDASRYKGVAFWARSAEPLDGVQVSFPDLYTDGAAPPHPMMDSFDPTNMCEACTCIYSGGSWQNCSPYLVQFGRKGDGGAAAQFSKFADTQITTTWRRYEILFADTRQDPGNVGYKSPGDKLAVDKLTAMALQVNPNYDVMPKMARDFEIWIDDVAFVR